MYLALYRKLRPNLFSQIIGQEAITRTLINQIKGGRVSHAYLFCGTRGTGKTSTAKVFAKAINCSSPVEGEACGHCTVCKAIEQGISLNVVEIDAASNNGVDNIRDIREEVKYPPTEGKYRVYIIDEVHMLSSGAFNALLKTLEEPPSHIVFILATTDSHKIPATILSRCQRFDFKRISSAQQFQTIKGYMQNETREIEDGALRYIISLSDGSMRDALSLLDQCLSFYINEKISLKMVSELVGSADSQVFFTLADALYTGDTVSVLSLIHELNMGGKDLGQFVSEFVTHLRNRLVVCTVENPAQLLDLSPEELSELQAKATSIGKDQLMQYINTFSQLLSQLKFVSNERILFEVACIKLCTEERGSSRPEPRAVGKPKARTELKAELKPETNAGVQPDLKNEAQPKAQVDVKPETKPVEAIVTPVAPNVSESFSQASANQALKVPESRAVVQDTPLVLESPAAREPQAISEAPKKVPETQALPEIQALPEVQALPEAQVLPQTEAAPQPKATLSYTPGLNINEIQAKWLSFIRGLDSPAVKGFLMQAKPGSLNGDLLSILFPDKTTAAFLDQKKAYIKEEICKYFQTELTPVFTTNEASNEKTQSADGFSLFKSHVNKEIKIID